MLIEMKNALLPSRCHSVLKGAKPNEGLRPVGATKKSFRKKQIFLHDIFIAPALLGLLHNINNVVCTYQKQEGIPFCLSELSHKFFGMSIFFAEIGGEKGTKTNILKLFY